MQEALVQAFPSALKQAVADPELWASAKNGIQSHISERAGGWLMRIVWIAVSRVLLFVTLGSLIYAIGGWSAVAAFFSKSEAIK